MFRYKQKMTLAACSFTLKQSGSSCGLPCQYGLLLSSVLLLPCSYADLRDPTAPVYAPVAVEQVPIVKTDNDRQDALAGSHQNYIRFDAVAQAVSR